MWRSALAGRRCLIVLDNAATSAQVVPLLPGSGTNLTLVTSRSRLAGLDGVRPRSLDVLSEDEAVDLFTRIVGDRALAEPAAVAEVVRRCGRLPLAIRLAAARLARRRRWRVADLVRRLGDAALPELAAEDRTVVAAFALSYRHLPDRPRRLFRLLAVLSRRAVRGEHRGRDRRSAAGRRGGHAGRPGRRVPGRGAGAGPLPVARPDARVRRPPCSPPIHRPSAGTRSCACSSTPCAVPPRSPLRWSPCPAAGPRWCSPPGRPELLPASDADPFRWIDAERTDYLAILRAAEAAGSPGSRLAAGARGLAALVPAGIPGRPGRSARAWAVRGAGDRRSARRVGDGQLSGLRAAPERPGPGIRGHAGGRVPGCAPRAASSSSPTCCSATCRSSC